MKINDAIETLQYFFLDLIGVIIPGAALIIGVGILFRISSITLSFVKDDYLGVLLVTLCYVTGHLVTSIGNVSINIISHLADLARKIPFIKKLIPDSIKTREAFIQDIQKSDSFTQFMKVIQQTPDFFPLHKITGSKNVNYWRDIALTIAKDEKNTVYKFVFISLLTSGIGTVLVLLALAWLIASLLNQFFGAHIAVIPMNYWILVGIVVASFPFFERNASFYGMSMRLPFAIATVNLITEPRSSNKVEQSVPAVDRNKPRIYLAGGFRSDWQGVLLKESLGFDFYDPRIHGRKEEEEYTVWDLEAIKNSDWIFAYLEKSNPAGYALALEVGYAKALGKRIVLVDDKSTSDTQLRAQLGMLYACADVKFTSLEAGIDYLKTLRLVFLDKSSIDLSLEE